MARGMPRKGIGRSGAWRSYTPASAVTITRPDGTVDEQPALTGAQLRAIVRMRPVDDSLRRAVKRRDRGTCRYCGTYTADSYQVDHVTPVAHGGASILANLVLACTPCNQQKANNVWTPTPLREHLERLTNSEPTT